MKQKIESAPLLLDALERLFHLSFSSHVERHEDRRLKLLRQRFDMFLCPVVQISDRQFRAQRPKRLGASPRDRLIVGDADHESLSSSQRNLGFGKYRNCHEALTCFGIEDECRSHSSDNVCCAIINSSLVGTM